MINRLWLSLKAWDALSAKIDPVRARMNWTSRICYRGSAANYSLLDWLQRTSQQDALKSAQPYPPIFLLGFWRSGTTFLHELFCCDSHFGFPSTYACLNPCHFLISERVLPKRATNQVVRRPMDSMGYSWASPQEDEFALLALGAPSAYEAILVPSLMGRPRQLLDLRLRPVAEQDSWVKAVQYFLNLLAVQQGKPMVLKSPPHGFRLHLLPTLFPKSRYVLIERNPYEVFASNLNLWQKLLQMYSLENWLSEEIESFVLAAYPIHEQIVSEARHQIAPGLISHVRYEDLVRDPIGEMRRLYTELGFEPGENIQFSWVKHVRSVGDYKRNTYLLSAEQKAKIDSCWGPIIREKGYGWAHDYIRLTKSAS